MDMTHLLGVRQQVLGGIKATDTLTNLMAVKLDSRVYACYLLHRAREELGHDQWALDDLAAMGIGEAEMRASRPVPACAAMVGYEHYIAMHANPVGLFGWMYILEAMGDNLGFLASDSITDTEGLTGGVKFLAGHGEADADHTVDLTEQITENVRDSERSENALA